MVGDILQPTHLLFILVVALLVLGPKRLPEVAKTLGTGLRDFREALSGESHQNRFEQSASQTYVPAEERFAPPVQVAPPVQAAPAEPAPAPRDLVLESSESAEPRTEPDA